MANVKWRGYHAKCPYYIKSYDYSIYCAIDPDGEGAQTVRKQFKTRKECHEHFTRYCARNCAQCGTAKFINKALAG